ncbi:MAG: NAD-binding protein [Bacilli bacterium]|nr:NAD-binding protein [Bacilli bacterium]
MKKTTVEKAKEKPKFEEPRTRSRTFVIGCGKLGASIANDSSRRGFSVVVIDSDPDSFALLEENFSGDRFVADAADLYALKTRGLPAAKEVIITTGDDNLSLFLAKACARIYQIPYIFVRFDDPDMGLLLQRESNIRIIYPFQLSRDYLNKLREEAQGK